MSTTTIILGLVVFLYYISLKSPFLYKQSLFITGMLISMSLTLVWIPVVIINPCFLNEIFAYLTSITVSLLTGIHITVEGEENLKPGTNPVIYLVNHQSTLDLLILAQVHQRNTLYVAKKQVAYIPFMGWIFYLGGNVLID